MLDKVSCCWSSVVKAFQLGTSFPFIMASSAVTKPFERKERARHTHTHTHKKEILEGRGKRMLCHK